MDRFRKGGDIKLKIFFNSTLFLKMGEGRFYLSKKNKAKKFTSYFIKTYRD
jgi:CTP-dependent riboflavin kinase